MPVGSADLHQAILAVWEGRNLDDNFSDYWPEADRDEFTPLNDGEAAPDHPFPYCVYTQGEGNTTARMTQEEAQGRYEIQDVPWTFKIYARSTAAVASKDVAAALAGAILAVFGGHPTETPYTPELEHGAVLIAQLQNELGMRLGHDEYLWTINYTFRLDVPVAA